MFRLIPFSFLEFLGADEIPHKYLDGMHYAFFWDKSSKWRKEKKERWQLKCEDVWWW